MLPKLIVVRILNLLRKKISYGVAAEDKGPHNKPSKSMQRGTDRTPPMGKDGDDPYNSMDLATGFCCT